MIENTRIQKIVCCLLVCIGIQTVALGQLRLKIRGGNSIETGQYALFNDIGFSGQLEIGYEVTPHIEVSLLYQHDILCYDYENGKEDAGPIIPLPPIGYRAYVNTGVLNGRYYFIRKAISCYGGLGIGVSRNSQFPEVIGEQRSGYGIQQTIKENDAINFVARPSIGIIIHTRHRRRGVNLEVAYLNSGSVGPFFVETISVSIGVSLALTRK